MREIEEELGINREMMVNLAALLGCDYCAGVKGVGPVLATEIIKLFGDLTDFKTGIAGKHENLTEIQTKFVKSHKKSLSKLVIFEPFPDPEVQKAFFSPIVDHNLRNFEWFSVKIDDLKRFLTQKLCWNDGKTEEFTHPLVSQTPIDVFFITDYYKQTKQGEAPRSKRLRNALNAG